MTATDDLRRLLDERGVGYCVSGYRQTWWEFGTGGHAFAVQDGPTVCVALTGADPAQAVEATLGRGTCRFEQIPEALYDDIECSECGVALWGFQMDIAGEGCPAKPRYCPNCGRRVVG